jgi:hypothetical protein
VDGNPAGHELGGPKQRGGDLSIVDWRLSDCRQRNQ